jgi:hydrogenase maturation protease
MVIMERILVIGYGNPHRGDDGFGFHAAEQLQTMIHEQAVTVMTVEQLKPEMAETIAQVDLVVFLEVASAGIPGAVHMGELFPKDAPEGLLSHDMNPGKLLAAAQIIYGRCPEAVMITVAGENFGFSAHLSPAVEAALPKVFERLKEIVVSAKDREPVRLRAHAMAAGS